MPDSSPLQSRRSALKCLAYGGAGTIFTLRFADPELDDWVRRAGELLFDWKNRDALQREWLSPDEYEQVKKRAETDGDL